MQKTDLTNSLTASYIFGKPPENPMKSFFDILKNKKETKVYSSYNADIKLVTKTYGLPKQFHYNKD